MEGLNDNSQLERKDTAMRISILLFGAAIVAAGAALSARAHGPEPQHKNQDTKTERHNDGGHAGDLGEPGDPKARARIVSVVMNDEMRYQPRRITVRQGETIRFEVKNAGKLKHEMTLGTLEELAAHAMEMQKNPEMEHDDPNSVSVEPGKTGILLWKFTKKGEFEFGCLVPGHFEGGMKGKIAVQ